MTDDRKDEAPAGSAEEWPKRAPPTIDLDSSEVSGDTRAASESSQGSSGPGAPMRDALAKFAAPLAGAVAGLLVVAVLWAAGFIGPQQTVQPAVSVAQFDNVAANVGDLSARIARVETAAAKAPTPANDPALAGRTEAVEKSLAAARDEVAKLNTQLRAVTASVNEVKATPRDGTAAAAPAPDLAPLNERLSQLEDATRTLSAELRKPAAAAVDINVRRLVIANTLEAAVGRGEPFAAALAAAKQVAADPNALAPLDAFDARGIPPEQNYLREIVPVLQRIADANAAKAMPADADKSAGGGILDKLKSGVANFVRLERDTGTSAAASSPLARERSVRRDDLAAARSDVAGLPQAADPQVQAWLKSVDARATALAAAQKFSAEALAAFGKSGQ
jgi:hypothetical protein